MATTRPFAYNPSQNPIDGTEQLSDLAIGQTNQEYSSDPGGVDFWMGPDESLGYVITIPVPSGDQPTPVGINAFVGFYISEFLTENSFVELTNNQFGQNFSDGNSAVTWLNSQGYWTSFVPLATPTPTPTVSSTLTNTPTVTSSQTPTLTPTQTNTLTPTPSITPTTTMTPTSTQPAGLLINLDSGNLTSYPGTGSTWYDLAGVSNNATLFNSPTYSSSYNGILQFDDVSLEYATIPNIGTLSNWTVEVWFRLTTSLTGKVTSIVSNEFNESVINFSIGTNNMPTNSNLAVGFYNIGSGLWKSTTGFVPVVGNWYQVVGTYDGTTVRQYVNGVASGGTLTTSVASQSGGQIRMMRRWDETLISNNLTDGDLSIVKIYNTVLSSSDILQSYNNTYTRFLEPTPTPTQTLTPSPTPFTTLAGSLQFNGTNQSLSLSPGVTFGAGAFTLEGWFYNDSLFTNKGIVGSPVTSPVGCLNLYFANGTTITSDRNGGGGSFSYTTSSAISANVWHYLIYNRNADGTTAVYIDGVRAGSTVSDTLNYSTATDTIGRYYGGYWSGYWTNMRMTVGTAVYNSNLTTQSTPREPLTSLANTKYLMLGAVVTTDSSGIQTVTNNNGVTQTSSEPF